MRVPRHDLHRDAQKFFSTHLSLFYIYGQVELKYANSTMNIQKGDVILLPACIQEVELNPSPEFQMLEVYIPHENK